MSAKPWVGKSVVIIDDSRKVREDLRETFKAIGVDVVGEADNGITGLEVVQRHRPEIVSLDIIMPEMDGVECYKKIQLIHPGCKIVMISWLSGELKVVENLKDVIPAHLFQTKPVNKQDLAARLEQIYSPNAHKDAAPAADSADDDNLADLGIKIAS